MTTTEAGATAPSEQTECGEHATHGYHKQKDEHLKRLRRIEGQIRGIRGMVENDAYCPDILVQSAAAGAALTWVINHYRFEEPYTWVMAAGIALIGAGVLLV